MIIKFYDTVMNYCYVCTFALWTVKYMKNRDYILLFLSFNRPRNY